MKKLLSLFIYLALISLLISMMAFLNGCGSNPTGDDNGGPPYTISGALYGGTEEGKALVLYSSSLEGLFSGSAASVEATMGHNSYTISGLPSGTYYVIAWQDLSGNFDDEPRSGSLLGSVNGKVWGTPDAISVTRNVAKDITLGCITQLTTDFATTYYVSGHITGGTTEAYILVGISTIEGDFEDFASGIITGYALKKPTNLSASGTYYFSALPDGTYYVMAAQDIDWTWGESMEALTAEWGSLITTVEVNGGNVTTGIDLTLEETN